MTAITSKPQLGFRIVDKDGAATQEAQNYFDDLEQRLNDDLIGNVLRLPTYTVATLPAVPPIANGIYMIGVSDETGGAVPAFSDGTNWRRVQDRAIVS